MEKLLQLCRTKIEDGLQWGPSDQWTSQDFETLSEKIFERTRVRLSVTTLKRIWGKVKYESSPNAVTLNALAKFMGYESWRNFRARYAIIQTDDSPANGQAGKKALQVKKKKSVQLLVVVPLFLLVLAFLSFLIMEKSDRQPDGTVEAMALKPDLKPVFESSKTSDDLPSSVVFRYDASMYNSDNVYIQQNWDPDRREKVDPNGNYHTSIYYTPGYFASKLIVDGEVKAEDIVFIQTQGWKGIVNLSPKPVYLPADEVIGEDVLKVTADLLASKTGSRVFNDTWTAFYNVQEFGVNGNNFTLEASLRNTSAAEESVCRNVLVYVLGKVSAVIVPLSDKGCISELRLLTGDSWIDGKQADLSAFGCDFRERQALKIAVANQVLEVKLNQQSILSVPVSRSIGDIIGLRFAFEGAGEVGDVKLSGEEGVVFEGGI